jgi:hypothetical protein
MERLTVNSFMLQYMCSGKEFPLVGRMKFARHVKLDFLPVGCMYIPCNTCYLESFVCDFQSGL